MDAPTLFAQMPPTPEGFITQRQLHLHAAYPQVSPATARAVDTVVEQGVRSLWPSRVKTVVPVLARREAVDWLHEQGLAAQPPAVAADRAGGATRTEHASTGLTAPRDVLPMEGDVMRLGDEEVWRR
jgi:hypothetical protein